MEANLKSQDIDNYVNSPDSTPVPGNTRGKRKLDWCREVLGTLRGDVGESFRGKVVAKETLKVKMETGSILATKENPIDGFQTFFFYTSPIGEDK